MMKTKLCFIILFLMCIYTNAQNRNITGTVKSNDGFPVPGANVVIQGTERGGTTDFDGKFNLEVLSSDKNLEVSYVGFQTKVINLEGKSNFTIVLIENVSKLTEVVVVGYGSQKRVNLTGAVGTISSESIESRPITSASQILAGKLPGVHIAQSSGIAGADGAEITIRGLGTLGNSSPLIVIDGVISDRFDFLNPSDIESISVLKDAASASIYGARAGNGVILITTKKGKLNSKSEFTYESGLSISQVTKRSRPKMITDPELFMTLFNEARTNSGGDIAFPEETIELYRTPSYRNRVNTNWYDEIVRVGITKEHNISARGGSETNQYFMSLGYLGQDAIILDGKYERISARINMQNQIVPKFKIGSNIGYTYGNQRTPNGSINDTYLLDVMRATPTSPAYTDDGLLARPDNTSLGGVLGQVQFGNPLAGYLANDVREVRNDIAGNMFVEYDVTNDIKLRGSFNSSISLNNHQGWYGTPQTINWRYKEILANPNDLNGDGIVTEEELATNQTPPNLGGLTELIGTGKLQIQSSQNYRINPDFQLNYKKNFGNHFLTLLAGTSMEKNNYKWVITERRNFESNYIKVLGAGSPLTIDNDSRLSKYAIVSQYGRLNYNYNDKYLFEANIRRDGSSRFGTNYRYGLFPSFSAGWTLSNEEFFKKNKVINFLKIRGSWGQLGNQSLSDDFPYIAKIGFTDVTYNFSDKIATGAIATSFGNPDLHWETTTMSDLGINLSLFNSAISIEADYFDRETKGVLYDTPIPQETGFSSVISNLAHVKNTGYELALNFKTKIKNLKISGGLNASKIKNKILSINPELSGEADRTINGNKILARGGSIDEFYLVKWTGGIFQSEEEVATKPHQFGAKAGDLILEDFSGPNGVPDGVIDGFDRQSVGTQYPDWTFGGDLNLNYKGFSFSANFQGIAGAKTYGAFEYFYPSFQGSNIAEHWVNRWTPDNPSTTMPRLWLDNGPNTENANTYFLMDRSYIRLRNIVIAYDLPSSFVSKISLTAVKFYISGQNLYTWTKNFKGFDPEVTRSAGARGGLPQATAVKFGIKLTL